MKHEQRKKNLLLETQTLIVDIEKHNETSGHKGLLKVLFDLQTQLNQEENTNFQWYSFAIYRAVTDDANFESSEIGQKLLHLSTILQRCTI